MKNTFSNSDRMLHIVLSDERLANYGEYNCSDYKTIDQALSSSNPIVVAVAKIIDRLHNNYTEKEIYNEVSNHLRNTL